MTIHEKIAVMTAYHEGKEIEIKRNEIATWSTCIGELEFNFQNYEYRIKPEKKPFLWNIENSEILLGKVVKYVEGIYLITKVRQKYFGTNHHEFYFVDFPKDLQIKIDNKWILFKDYRPE